MFNIFRKKEPPNIAPVIGELKHLYHLISKLNIPVVADDVDAGYDMAIDEVLDLIKGRINYHKNPTTENS